MSICLASLFPSTTTVQTTGRPKVIEMVSEVMSAQSYESARKRMDEVIEALEKTHPKVALLLEEHGEEILTVYQLPLVHRQVAWIKK